MPNARGQYENFLAVVTRSGSVVPGTERRGHNVVTSYGHNWLMRLVGWATLTPGVNDVATTEERLRWISLGTGWQPEIPGVLVMGTPIEVVSGSGVYLAELDPAGFSRPVSTSLKIHHQFLGSDIGVVSGIREFGLHAGYKDSGSVIHPDSVDPLSVTSPVVAYKQIDPVDVGALDTLHVYWEFRF
jgi:hypothetical protein